MHSGARVRNTWVIYPQVWNSSWKRELIPDVIMRTHVFMMKALCAWGWARVPLASWWGNGPPRQWWVAGLRGRSATLGLRTAQTPTGGCSREFWAMGESLTQQCRVRDEGLRIVNRCQEGRNLTVPLKEVTANYVPAAAVIRRWQALFGFIGRKGSAGGLVSLMWNPRAQLGNCIGYCWTRVSERRLEFQVKRWNA